MQTPVAPTLGSYWVGDVPTNSVEVEFIDEYNEVTEPPTAALTALLVSPARDASLLTVASDPAEPLIRTLEWTGNALNPAGVWQIIIREDGVRRSEALTFVVQDDDGWVTLGRARADWADAPTDDVYLYRILEVARIQCLAFAPAQVAGAPVPPNFVQAQLAQARAIWNFAKANPQDQIGMDGQAVRVYPLDDNIRKLLRPRRAMPVVR